MSIANSLSPAGRELGFENSLSDFCGRRCPVNPLDTSSQALIAVKPLDSPNSPFTAGNPLTSLSQGHEQFSCNREKGT